MPRKKKEEKYNIDDELIIGYNTSMKKDKPSKKRKKGKKKRKNKVIDILKLILKILIAILASGLIIIFLFISPVFNVEEISVIGAEEITESVYIAMSGIEVGENIFGVDKMYAESTITKEPYVEEVEIKTIYPRKIEINVKERKASYIVETGGKYGYIDKNGYLLERSMSPLDLPKITGYNTNFEELELGQRMCDSDLLKFNDLIKIIDALKNNMVSARLTSIDITDENNYVLEFADENKKVMLGTVADLSIKMSWINVVIDSRKDEAGIIHLDTEDVYFSPNK